MKALLINNLYGRRARGGAERVVEAEARGLAARGHEVVVVSGIPESDMASGGVCGVDGCCARRIVMGGAEGPIRTAEYHPSNIFSYEDLRRHSWPARLTWHVFDIWNPGSARTLMTLVRREKPDVVHTHNLMGLGFSIPRALKREGVRYVHTVHDVQLLHPSGLLPADWRGPRWPHERIYIALMKRRMGSPDVVLFPSEFMKGLHERFGFFPESKRVVLRNPALSDGARRGKTGQDGATRLRQGFGGQGRGKTGQCGFVLPQANGSERLPRFPAFSRVLPRFLFVGQLEEHKGILDLLDAWMLWEGRGSATLTVVGSGTLEETVKLRAEYVPNMDFRGRLEGDEFSREIDRASWLVVPSRVLENAPTVIVEALARGIPVIASRSGGIPELVRDGENGLLFEPGDKEGLLAALVKAESSKLKAESIGDMPTIDEHLEVLEGLYR